MKNLNYISRSMYTEINGLKMMIATSPLLHYFSFMGKQSEYSRCSSRHYIMEPNGIELVIHFIEI